MSAKRAGGIAVLIPSSGRRVAIEWAVTLPQFAFPVGMNHMWFVDKADPTETDPAKQFTRDQQREKLTETAVQAGVDFIMWIDDDTICPARTITELFYVMSQNPNAAIVGGIYCTKEDPASPIVFMELGGGPYWQWTLGDVFKCKGLGTGCMMVRASVLKNIPKPWFKDTSEAPLHMVNDYNGVNVAISAQSGTDDIYFCKKVAEAGYDIIAHGGVLPVHVDEENRFFKIPRNSYPVTSYQEKLDKLNATLPEGQKRILLP